MGLNALHEAEARYLRQKILRHCRIPKQDADVDHENRENDGDGWCRKSRDFDAGLEEIRQRDE